MFAVFKAGNSQYKVKENDEIKVDKIEGEIGTKITYNEILVLGSHQNPVLIGTPYVKGVTIEAEILSTTRDKKILVFKKKRRKNYARLKVNRKYITSIIINRIINK
jgi:large subunit ribosomal protein L21